MYSASASSAWPIDASMISGTVRASSGVLRRLRSCPALTFIPAATAAAAVRAGGADRIEIYTEPYAASWGSPKLKDELDRVKRTAAAAVAAGMQVNAGHDLNLRNTPLLARTVPEIIEASIGHALIADALYLGLAETVRRYVRACRGEAVDAPVTQ